MARNVGRVSKRGNGGKMSNACKPVCAENALWVKRKGKMAEATTHSLKREKVAQTILVKYN